MNDAALNLDRASQLFGALSDPTRLCVLQMLAGGERCVCDLQEAVGAYQSRLSFHLRKLKDAGLVDDRKDGRWVYYALRPQVMDELRAFLSDVCSTPAQRWVREDGCCT